MSESCNLLAILINYKSLIVKILYMHDEKSYFEVNFDGIPAPYHNYGGLSEGNLASSGNAGQISRPREAALQALAKAKFLADLGVRQAILPPHFRPDPQLLAKHPERLVQLCSSSAMWTANAATICPSADGSLGLVVANLQSNFHREIEAPQTEKILRQIFRDAVHSSVTSGGDEGAANHMRLALKHGEKGVHIFVYGAATQRFPARQSLAASMEVAAKLGLDDAIFVQQNPAAIDAGVFHNDVIAVSNEDVLLMHERAFSEPLPEIEWLKKIVISEADLSTTDAVSTYFFNSQIVTLPRGEMLVIAPQEVREHVGARALMEKHFARVEYFNLKQSMKNGGGPACLRLRVLLNEAEISAIKPRVFLDDALYAELVAWVNKHYRKELQVEDLADKNLHEETRAALAELEKILQLEIL